MTGPVLCNKSTVLGSSVREKFSAAQAPIGGYMKRTIIYLALMSCLWIPALSETPISFREARELGLPVASPLAVIPTSANSPGRYGAFFKTRVVIHNMARESYNIRAVLCTSNGIEDSRSITMQPRQYRFWDNFLDAIFGYRGTAAIVLVSEDALESNSPQKFSVTAEVYTDSPNGRYTTTVVNGIIPLVDQGTEAFNTAISVNRDRRVNIGVFNAGDSASSIRARVHDQSGTLIQTIRFEAEEFTWHQKSVTVPVDNGLIQWEITGGLSFLWAVTVDNRSNDGTLIWPMRPEVVE